MLAVRRLMPHELPFQRAWPRMARPIPIAGVVGSWIPFWGELHNHLGIMIGGCGAFDADNT